MDSYIVRVLRREQTQKDRSSHLDGVVEVVENGKQCVFHNAEELWSILGGERNSSDEQVFEQERFAEEGTHQDEV